MDLARISACTYPLRDQPVERALRVIVQCGFSQVDLWGGAPHFSADPTRVDPATIEAAAASAGVAIANLGSYAGAGFADESKAEQVRALDEMKATIDLAVRFGARSIRVRPGTGEDPSIIDRLVPWFQQSASYAEERGSYLGMENHGGSLAGLPDACVELCEKVGSKRFGILYEPCNLMHAKVDYRAVFGRFAPWIVHIHVKDGRWTEGTFERAHLGEGEIDYRWVIDKMAGIGYEGHYALEYEICDIEPIETGLPRWLDYFKRL
jgi:sugar phosphate isomerase/epimerase